MGVKRENPTKSYLMAAQKRLDTRSSRIFNLRKCKKVRRESPSPPWFILYSIWFANAEETYRTMTNKKRRKKIK
jgi:hypothetical protein